MQEESSVLGFLGDTPTLPVQAEARDMRRTSSGAGAVALTWLAVAGCWSPAWSQEPGAQALPPGREAAPPRETTVHPEARKAIEELWSPYCPGLMLEVCPSSGGVMLRDSIDRMARSGLAADSIVELVLAEYGERYRAQPRATGFGGLAWLVPPVVLGIGLAVIGLFLARRRRGSPRSIPVEGPTAAERERVAAAMEALDADEAPDF
jgi:cytochrome c-type biogenesis protein CcmH/NrfF